MLTTFSWTARWRSETSNASEWVEWWFAWSVEGVLLKCERACASIMGVMTKTLNPIRFVTADPWRPNKSWKSNAEQHPCQPVAEERPVANRKLQSSVTAPSKSRIHTSESKRSNTLLIHKNVVVDARNVFSHCSMPFSKLRCRTVWTELL